MLTKYPALVSTLNIMIQSQDDTLQTVAFETIGYIGVSLEGKLALVELGNVMTECIDKMGEVIRDSATEMKISAMNALASLVKLDKENQTEQMLTITETWYTRIPNITNTLVNVIKQPFLDLRLEFLFTIQKLIFHSRLASYQLMYVLAGQSWGRRLLMLQPGK